MGLAQTKHRVTEAEYLEFERTAEYRSEFLDGEIFAMAGASPQHSRIATNLAREVGNRLSGRNCLPYNADLRVKVEACGLNAHPDLTIICGPLQFAEGTKETVVNPTVLVEVLSDSNEAYDRGKKFGYYRQIPTLREYLLVSQHEPLIEHFIRQDDGRWLLSEASGFDASLELPSIGISIALREVFANVEFAPPPPPPPDSRVYF